MKKFLFLLFAFSTSAFSAQTLNTLLVSSQTVAAPPTSAIMSLNQMTEYDIMASITSANGSNKTFSAGVDGVDTITFQSQTGSTDGDYVVIYTSDSGGTWAAALDTTGAQLQTPTGSAWTAVASGNKTYCNVSGATPLFYAAWTSQLNANVAGGSSTVTAVNGAAISGGFLNLTGATNKSVTINPTGNLNAQQIMTFVFDYKPNYSGTPATQQFVFAVSKAVNDDTNLIDFLHWTDGHIYVDLYDQAATSYEADLGIWAPVAGTTYHIVTQIDITTGANKVFIDGVQQGSTDTHTATRSNAIAYAAVGAGTDFGTANANFSIKNFAYYSSIVSPTARTAAQVATSVKNCLNALTGYSTVITSSDAGANGTLVNTQTVNGPVTVPAPHNFNDSGVGSITAVENTPGAIADITVSSSTVTVTGHGYHTGAKVTLTTTGALPAPLLTATDYYLIVVDSNTLRFATSQANAIAGTYIVFTNSGSGTDTIVVNTTITGSIKLQKNDEPLYLTPIWFDVSGSSQNFTGTTNLNWTAADVAANSLRAVVTLTSGTVTMQIRANAKGW